MKKLVIASGNWTTGGNFSGYDSTLGRVHIFGTQMKGLGFESGSTVTFPLFGITGDEKREFDIVKVIDVLDENGKPTGETKSEATGEKFTRWQANSLFKDRKSLVETLAAGSLIDMEVKQYVKGEATSAGLTEAEVEALVAASI